MSGFAAAELAQNAFLGGRLQLWQPLVHSVVFILVLLGLGCYYVTRKDF